MKKRIVYGTSINTLITLSLEVVVLASNNT